MNLFLPLCLKQVSLQAAVGSDLILQDISFKVERGENLGIVGVSGSGKSSLLRLLNRLVSPSSGEIWLGDRPIAKCSSIGLRRQIVLVPQESKLLGMTVADALKYPLELQQLPQSQIQSRLETWMNLLHLPAEWLNKNELQLSVGQRQLAAIARALMMQPQAILLDEPTSALDLGLATHVLSVLQQQNKECGLTVIMVNHQLELLENFCQRLLFVDRGSIEADISTTAANFEKLRDRILQFQQQDRDWD